MPEKKIIEAVTSTLPVIGSSIATATAGPMPGSTPTAVPSAQPTRHQSRFAGVIAAAKPCMRALNISIKPPAGLPQGRLAPPRGAANECESGGCSSDPPCCSEARQIDGEELREHP